MLPLVWLTFVASSSYFLNEVKGITYIHTYQVSCSIIKRPEENINPFLCLLCFRQTAAGTPRSSAPSIPRQFPPSHSSLLLVTIFVSPCVSQRGSWEMNIFRLSGDMFHLFSILLLLLKIHTIKSCAGMFWLNCLYIAWHIMRKIYVLLCIYVPCNLEDSRKIVSFLFSFHVTCTNFVSLFF